MTTYSCEFAWLTGDSLDHDVVVEVRDGRFLSVESGVAPPPGATRLRGIVIPGLANVHSHAFHRALRGRTPAGAGSFWSWRTQMYDVAERLDPDNYLALARATYAEMALAGITCVGEFHYLHHGPGGTAYDDPNAMSYALVQAAAQAGIRLTLIDACYLTSAMGEAVTGAQLRFSDGNADNWAARLDAFKPDAAHVRTAAAVHSVRAVPRDQIPSVAAWAHLHDTTMHIHLSEQVEENDACKRAHGMTPTRLLADTDVLGVQTVAIHATHLTDDDIGLLGASEAAICLCPSTERDLGDGIGPAPELAAAGSMLSLGTDSHAVIDVLGEAAALELDERLRACRRGTFDPDELLRIATTNGHCALNWPESGVIAPGAPADLVAIRLDSVRTAGTPPTLAAAVFAATAADVTDVIIDGREVVVDGVHQLIDTPAELARSIQAVVE